MTARPPPRRELGVTWYGQRTSVNVFFGAAGEDRATFEEFGLTAGYPDTAAGIESWRRDNITGLVTQVVAVRIERHHPIVAAVSELVGLFEVERLGLGQRL